MNSQPPNKILRLGLYGNAAFSLGSAILLIAASAPIARLMGVPQPLSLTLIGVLLLPFSVHLWIAARRPMMKHLEIVYFCAMDGLWILGSIALLATRAVPLNLLGLWAVAIVALFVMDFFLLQLYGLVRSRRTHPIR